MPPQQIYDADDVAPRKIDQDIRVSRGSKKTYGGNYTGYRKATARQLRNEGYGPELIRGLNRADENLTERKLSRTLFPSTNTRGQVEQEYRNEMRARQASQKRSGNRNSSKRKTPSR